ncbi:MAG: hypothetical protein ABID83_01265 [Candidatus Omnitrophota bacterium]
MRKYMIFLLFLFLSVMVISSCSQALTDKQERAYDDMVDTFMERVIDSGSSSADGDFLDSVIAKAASKYGIGEIEAENIYFMSSFEQEFTQQELDMGGEFWDSLQALPGGGTREERIGILRERADKYGVTPEKVKEMAFRVM